MAPLKITTVYLCIILIATCCSQPGYEKLQPDMVLWYDKPAGEWVEALPVGNGRLGAMIYGQPYNERIQLNEESIWAGSPLNNNNPEALENLPLLRRLLFDMRVEEAQEMVANHFTGTPPRIRSYQTAGDLFISTDSLFPYTDYKRTLCLETGVATTTFNQGDVRMTREVIASAPADAVIIRIASSEKGTVNLTIKLERERDAIVRNLPGGILLMEGQINDEDDPLRGPGGKHMKFAGMVRAVSRDGEITGDKGRLEVTGATELMLIWTAATDYDPENLGFRAGADPADECIAIISSIEHLKFKDLLHAHINDHSRLFNRVKLDLGGQEAADKPVDRRLEMLRDGAADPHLAALMFQYGRYLLMGSSRSPGVLPANLQGIWNEHFNAPWNSDFHTNINLQMNYWPSEVTNLPETVEPLVVFLSRLTRPGNLTTREMYGAGGWTLHHLTDPFGRTGVMDGPWGLTPMCGPWMTFPVWRHYAYSLDTDFLREHTWPLLEGSARFILDFLVESPEGYLVTNPSHSPENRYYLPGTGRAVTLTYGAAMDIQIAREVLTNTVKASEILGSGQELAERCRLALQKLPPLRIGEDGTIMEWIEDYREPEPGHRHMSHLLGLYPLHHITPEDSVIFDAAARTIEKRLAHGGGHTGWSRAWIINFFNRLYNSERAYENLVVSMQRTTLNNLFSTHPPFQIDGNFGTTAGIAGMLIGSAPGTIELLPALPADWQRGSFSGLRAQGGFTVTAGWEDGRLVTAEISASVPGNVMIRYKDVTTNWEAEKGGTLILDSLLQPV